MATFTSRTKKNNVSDNEKNTSNGNNPIATLSSPVAQLFRDDQSTDDFKQEDGSLAIKGIHSFGEIDIPSSDNASSKQLKSSPSFPAIQRKSQNNNAPVPVTNNKTGLPNNLKSGVEQLSGKSIDDVKVHYNSKEPKQLNALAYAKGTEIHVGPGNEKHLPHEAWHVVQQKQGRVQPTKQLKGKVPLNDDKSLENEADLMGEKALNLMGKNNDANNTVQAKMNNSSSAIVQRVLPEKDKKMLESVSGVSTNISAFEGGSKPPTDNITSAAPAVEEPVSAAPAVEEQVSAAPAVEEPVSAAPAVEEQVSAAPAVEEQVSAAPAVEEQVSAAPAVEQEPTAPMALTESKPEEATKPEESKSLMEQAGLFVKSNRIGAATTLGGIGVNTAKYAEQGVKASDFAHASQMAAAGTVTTAAKISGIGGAVLGGLTAAKGIGDMYGGGKKSYDAENFLKDEKNAKNVTDAERTKERVKQRIASQDGKDQARDGAYGFVSGSLSAGAGVATATGLGVPLGLGLGIAGMAVSAVGSAHGALEQRSRDQDYRRVRTKDQIGQEKLDSNKAREGRIAGSGFNPLNWGAKLSRLTGIGDSEDKKIGTEAANDKFKAHKAKEERIAGSSFNPLNWGAKLSRLTGIGDGDKAPDGMKDQAATDADLKKYTESKREKYQSEGYDYTDFDGKTNDQDASKKITKKDKSGGSWNPFNWGAKKEDETIDTEDIMVKKGLNSEETSKRKEEEVKKKSWFGF